MDQNGKILLIRLKALGDITLTLPAVHQLRTSFPSASFSFLVSKEFAPLLQGFRDVEAVIPLDRSRFRGFHPKAAVSEALSLLRVLRRSRFTLVVDFQGYGETAWLTRWTGAAERWGMVRRPSRGWAYTRQFRREPSQHPVECNLALICRDSPPAAPVRNEFVLPANALEEGRRFFGQNGLDLSRPTLFIQPFTSSPHKDWPLVWYLELAGLGKRGGWQVLFGGGPGDRARLEPARAAGFPVAAGTPLIVSASLMKLATVVLGSDTGLVHLGVAMGKRVVMLMDSLGVGGCHPFQHPEWALAPPAGQPVTSIPVGAVLEACTRALSEVGFPAKASASVI
jgi:ADP-heptose:LPS heptosyltransferase